MNNFKETEISKIPNDWREYKLGELVTFQRGHDLSKNLFIHGKYPIAGSNGIIGYHNEYTTKAPSITIGRSGNIGTPHFYNKNFWAHNTVLYIKEFYNSDPKFIFYLLKTLNFKQLNSGSAVPSLNRNFIHPIKIIAPKFKKEQNEIAHILSSFDDKIELNNQMNKTLEKTAQTLFKRWFIDFEFLFDFAQGKPNENGEPYKSSGGEMIESELGLIPKGWRVGKLEDEFNITMGQSPPGKTYNEDKNGIPFFQGNADFNFRFPSYRIYCTEPKRFAEKFNTLISVRAPVGEINMAFDKCCIGRGLTAINHKSNYYSYTYYKMISLKSYFQMYDKDGTVFGSMNKNNLENKKIIIPTDEIVLNLEKLINPIDSMIFELSKESQIFSQIRDALLPKLMKGEIRVENIKK